MDTNKNHGLEKQRVFKYMSILSRQVSMLDVAVVFCVLNNILCQHMPTKSLAKSKL